MHQPGPADHPREIADLAGEVVGIRLEEQGDLDVGTDHADRIVDVEEVALEQGQARGREHDAPPAHGHEAADEDDQAKDERGEPVLEEAHGRAPTRASASGSGPWARPMSRRCPGLDAARRRRLDHEGRRQTVVAAHVEDLAREVRPDEPQGRDRDGVRAQQPFGRLARERAPSHRRVGPLRADSVDADPLVGPLLGQALGHVDQGRLAGRIGHVIGPAAGERARGEHRQRAAGPAEEGVGRSSHVQGAGEVDVDDLREHRGGVSATDPIRRMPAVHTTWSMPPSRSAAAPRRDSTLA